jgi:hypothetical protein
MPVEDGLRDPAATSDGLLLGIWNARRDGEGPEEHGNELRELLAYVGRDESSIMAAIHDVRGSRRLDYVENVLGLDLPDDIPLLTSSTTSIVETARDLAATFNKDRPGHIRLKDLFGALLHSPSTDGYVALGYLLPGPDWIVALQRTYQQYLEIGLSGQAVTYAEFLRDHHPPGEEPITPTDQRETVRPAESETSSSASSIAPTPASVVDEGLSGSSVAVEPGVSPGVTPDDGVGEPVDEIYAPVDVSGAETGTVDGEEVSPPTPDMVKVLSPPRSTAPSLIQLVNYDGPTEVDRLKFGPLVQSIAATFTQTATTLPLAVAVTAPWGAGKSSVMMQLRKQLYEQSKNRPNGQTWEPNERRWFTVWFPAWKYESGEPTWAAMAKEMYRQPQDEMTFREKWWFRAWLQFTRLQFWALLLTLVGFGVAGASAWAAQNLSGTFDDLFNDREILGVGLAGALTTGSFQAFGWLGSFVKSINKKSKPSDDASISKEASSEVQRLTQMLTTGPRRGVAVFIDDLDRCSPASIAEMIETINQIFNCQSDGGEHTRKKRQPDPQFLFLLGMDREIVSAAIEVEYKDVVERLNKRSSPLALDFGHRFLEKVTQLTVCVPKPDEGAITKLITGEGATISPDEQQILQAQSHIQAVNVGGDLSGVSQATVDARQEATASQGATAAPSSAAYEAGARREIAKIVVDSPEFRAAETEILKLVPPNPRQVKRFDTAFRLQLTVLGPFGHKDFSQDSLIAIGKVVALRLWWPGMAIRMDEEPGLVSQLENHANGAVAVPPPINPWLANPRADKLQKDRNLASQPEKHADGSAAMPDNPWLNLAEVEKLLKDDDPARRITAQSWKDLVRIV